MKINAPDVSVADVKAGANIAQIAEAVGCTVRRSRCNAIWRGGDGMSVSLDVDNALFFDHKANLGGDVIDLVMKITGLDFKGAVAWIAEFTGSPTPTFRRQDAAPKPNPNVERVARDLAQWKQGLVDYLEGFRDSTRADVGAVADLVSWRPDDYIAFEDDDELLRDHADAAERLKVAAWVDDYIARLHRMTAHELLQVWARLELGEAA